jgi:hypothetical protein
VSAIRRLWERLLLEWEAGLRGLPFFTQRTAVLLLGVLVATLALLGGVVALVGWPGANGPTRLVPGERAGQAPVSRPEPAGRPAAGASGAGVRSGADASGAVAASPASAPGAAPSGGAAQGEEPGGAAPGSRSGGAAAEEGPGGASSGAGGSGGAAGAGAGGPPAAPPTTTPPPTTPQGPLDPVEELLGPVVDPLLPKPRTGHPPPD